MFSGIGRVNSNKIERTRLENEIKILRNKVKIAKARIAEIESEMKETHNRNTIHVVWYDYTPGNYKIYYKRGK